MTFDEILDRNLDEFFWDVINSRSSFLRNDNEEYKEIFARICEIVDERFPDERMERIYPNMEFKEK